MVKNDEIDWSEWYDMTRENSPSELLTKALVYVKNNGKALDIGGGALKDTRYLLDKGFDVTVIDKSPLLIKEAARIKSAKIHPFVTSFEDFIFPVDEFDLVSAMQCLSYCKSENFKKLIGDIKLSLKDGGIFCGQMYGVYDEWSKRPETRNVHPSCQTIDEAKDYLKDMEVIFFQEEETKEGRTKHWQVFNFITRKIS